MEENPEQAGLAAEEKAENPGQQMQTSVEEEEGASMRKQTEKDITSPFDEALGNHIERLLGSRHGVDDLPLNLFTVSSLLMIATRETEIENFPYLPPQRYTHTKLSEEMVEIFMHPGRDIHSEIQNMIEKGYIEVHDGRFFAREPAIIVARLIDKIFPKMPGLNLVAYIGQMMDEANTGRKDIEAAVNQFNQMLEMHGVPVKKETEGLPNKTQPYPYLKATDAPAKKKSTKPSPIKPANIYSQLKTMIYASSLSETETPSLAANGEEAPHREDAIVSLEKSEDEKKEDLPEENETEMDQESTAEELKEKVAFESAQEQSDQVKDDEDIEKKIAEFEEQLGMTCPLCRTAGIRANETARGKIYYHCINKDCNFISWGKPYYITCPRCSNSFLVEASNSVGKAILKCPRATCHHWQNFPWDEPDEIAENLLQSPTAAIPDQKPQRKVRRRRVVRRKR
jgi:ssDNA-binding Zn-finger/Zn-ribbon topoisomerase 1